MASAVLDSSAILAVVNSEPGAAIVIGLLNDAVVSAVNHAETMSKLIEKGLRYEEARTTLGNIGAQVVDFDEALADRVGVLRAGTKHLGLSLGDRACLALAERQGAQAVTADRKWESLELNIEIKLIR
jgi:ribonuclease VapC